MSAVEVPPEKSVCTRSWEYLSTMLQKQAKNIHDVYVTLFFFNDKVQDDLKGLEKLTKMMHSG